MGKVPGLEQEDVNRPGRQQVQQSPVFLDWRSSRILQEVLITLWEV